VAEAIWRPTKILTTPSPRFTIPTPDANQLKKETAAIRRRCVRLVLIGGATLLVSACATGEERGTWRQHPTHFASADHLFFSVRNRQGTAPRVTRQDIAMARSEGWWGQPITVGQEQILER
jgi:hypothetical protein